MNHLPLPTLIRVLLLCFFSATVWAQPRPTLEALDRGLIAAKVTTGVHLSWRLLINEVSGFSATGLTGTDFNVYRDGALLATVTDSTNYRDLEGTLVSQYFVRAVRNGAEVGQSKTITPLANANFLEVPMKRPAAHIDPAGVSRPYVAGDMSVGDVDGDGEYECFVKWESSPQDVIGKGYTGGNMLDCYKLDGRLLYRLDLGKNIRAGAHYTQFMVYDFNGDGKAEIIFKTAPGTSTVKFNPDGTEASRTFITMTPEDIAAGWTHADDYRSTNASFYEHVVEMFLGWATHPEVLAGHWPAKLQDCWGAAAQSNAAIYALNSSNAADARLLADYFIDVYAPSRSVNNQLRNFTGYIFKGPEYLTIFNGETGDEMQTIPYKPARADSGLLWGDYAGTRIEPCNRVDRLQACVASLDGQRAFAIFGRGYYTRTTFAAYSWDGQNLQEYWFADSGYPIYPNPFNTSPHGIDGRIASHAKITTQGAHTLMAADVDGDGLDEIINGSSSLDHDGSVLYSSFALITQGPNTGAVKRLGHGDALHVADLIPGRPGLETFMCHEEGTNTNYGISMRDARTGEFIWGVYSGTDTGRCMVGDINPSVPGLECWGFQNFVRNSANGANVGGSPPSTNQNLRWAANMTYQFMNGVNVQQWNNGVLSNAFTPGIIVAINNGTKANPGLQADVFGDWREEVILRRTDNTAFRIYFNTDVATRKMFTLMHDRKYRMDIARQNTGYNQPPYPSFYLASDTDFGTLYNQVTKVTGIIVAPNPVTIEGGSTAQLTATVLPENANNPDVIWTSANSAVASVTQTGLVTGVSVGATVVSASSVEDPNIVGSSAVTVVDTTPPVIASLTVSKTELWPANHKMVLVTVTPVVSDTMDPSPVSKIVLVTSNEPLTGTGPDDVGPNDWTIQGPLIVDLRAERAEDGAGRIYTITVEAKDASGNVSYETVTVTVPHDRRK